MSLTSFLFDWTFQPSVALGLALVAALYAVGLRELARRDRLWRVVKPRHVAYFALGLLAVLLALMSPLDTLDTRLFTLHMAQHMLLLMIAPTLLLLGKPIPVLLVGAPRDVVRGVTRLHRRTPWLHRLTRLLTMPLVAWVLYNLDLLLWHLPALYEATLRHEGVHLLEHVCFLATGLLFWWIVVEPLPGKARLHPGLRMLYIWAAAIPNTLLGMIFATDGAVVYRSYAQQRPLWGISPLDDQHLAGLVMWFPGDMMCLVAGVALFFVMMTPDENTLIADAENIARQAGKALH